MKKKAYMIVFFIIIAIITIAIINSQSKYKMENQSMHTQNSEFFYFESDILDIETKEYTYLDYNENEEYIINFNLCNYADELRVNNLDTQYTINTTVILPEGEIAKTYINGVETQNGTMDPGIKQDDKIEIKVNTANNSNIKIKIEAIATAPYSKNLSAIINIQEKEKIEPYQVNLLQDSETDYEKLLIKTNDFSGKLKIAYNSANTNPDPMNDLIQGSNKVKIADDIFYVEIEIEANSNYQIDFIKNNSDQTLTIGDSILNSDIVVGYE